MADGSLPDFLGSSRWRQCQIESKSQPTEQNSQSNFMGLHVDKCISQSEHALYGKFIIRKSHLMTFTNKKNSEIFSKTAGVMLTCVQTVILTVYCRYYAVTSWSSLNQGFVTYVLLQH